MMKFDFIAMIGVLILVILVKITWYKQTFRASVVRVTFLGILVILLLIIVPNALSPITPHVNGKLVDLQTGKPISGASMIIAWSAKFNWADGGIGKINYRICKTTSDGFGTYNIPMGIKAFSIITLPGLPIYERKFDDVKVLVRSNDYEYMSLVKHVDGKVDNKMTMTRVTTDREFFENVLLFSKVYKSIYGYGLEKSDAADKAWLLKAYYEFERRYPHSYYDEKFLIHLADLLYPIDVTGCRNLLEKFVKKYPKSSDRQKAERMLKKLRNKHGVYNETTL